MKHYNDTKVYITLSRSLTVSVILHLLLVFLINSHESILQSKNIVEFNLIEDLIKQDVKNAIKNEKSKINNYRNKQIVDQDDTKTDDGANPDSRFLSKYNQKVQKQTAAKKNGLFQNKNQKAILFAKPEFNIEKLVQKRDEYEKKFDVQKENSASYTQSKNLNDLSSKNRQTVILNGQSSQTMDYLPDIESGDQTILNTQEFIYYSYFSRIRNQLHQRWGSIIKEKLSKISNKNDHLIINENMITKCLLILDASGNLITVQILRPSGLKELDEAAFEALNSSAPFPNPPKGIIDTDGKIKIRWDFVIEI